LFTLEKRRNSIYDKIKQKYVTKITYQQDLHLLSPKIVKKTFWNIHRLTVNTKKKLTVFAHFLEFVFNRFTRFSRLQETDRVTLTNERASTS